LTDAERQPDGCRCCLVISPTCIWLARPLAQKSLVSSHLSVLLTTTFYDLNLQSETMVDQPAVVNYYAILIGIDSYSEEPLKGCVRDVEEIKKYLEQDISSVDIQTFTADASSQHEDSKARPTDKNVTSAIRDVTSRARTGDYVYIHFSGHGTRKESMSNDEFSDEAPGDLALVLLDNNDKQRETYLRGPRLGRYYIQPLVNKGVIVTIVLDCCFSADVYRQDNAAIRFHPYNAKNDSSWQYCVETEEPPKSGTCTREVRNASTRQNWLLNPDGYAILAACGPNEGSGEIVVDGVTYGKLSYFLRQSFAGPGGCKKAHSTIHQNLCAEFQSHKVQQRPVLFGKRNQGFFGKAELNHDSLLRAVKNSDGKLRLLAGQAHGFSEHDCFELSPSSCHSLPGSKATTVRAAISQLGGLTSVLGVKDIKLDEGQTVWIATALTQSRLRNYLVDLHPELSKRDQWKSALAERCVAIKEDNMKLAAFYIIPREDRGFDIQDEHQQLIVNPSFSTNDYTYLQAPEAIEHLARFALTKGIANTECRKCFRNRFDVYVTSNGDRYGSDDRVHVGHGNKIKLVLENYGDTPMFFAIYGLRPSWQNKNLLAASHKEVPSPESGSRCFERSLNIKMTVPEWMTEKGLRACTDFIKVFVTPELSLFDLLELPRLGEGMKSASMSRVDRQQIGVLPEEDWDSFTFEIRVSM
jgi:hypothetical protein